jgi:hypothetical protein
VQHLFCWSLFWWASLFPLSFTTSLTYPLLSPTGSRRNVSLSQAKGGPDAPFELQLLTVVQPHKQMAEKMKKPKGHTVPAHVRDQGEEAEEAEQQEEEGAGAGAREEEEEDEGKRDREERKVPQRAARAAKKGRKGEEEEEEGMEGEDSDGENQDVNVSPDSSRKPAKGGKKTAAAGKGAGAAGKGAGGGKKAAVASAAAPARPMAKRSKA